MLDDVPHPADVADEGYSAYRPVEPEKGIKPPHSLEAEREVLSAVLVDPDAMGVLRASLRSEDFYFHRHQLLFGVLRELHERGTAIDVVTLQQGLKDRGQYDKVGGARGIGELLDRAGTVSNLEHYVGIVRDQARLRRIVETAQAVEVLARGDIADVGEFVGQVGSRWARVIGEVATPVEPMRLRTLHERMESGEADWIASPPPEAPVLLKSGGMPFMRDGRVAAVIAPGGTGKTYALLDLAVAVSTGGKWLDTYDVVHRGKVFLGLGEEDEDEVRRRLWHIAQELDEYDRHELARNLVVVGLMGQPVAMMQRSVDGNVCETAWYTQLRESLIQQGPWRAVILDPWSRWGGPEAETDAHVATYGISMLESLTRTPGNPAVIVAHHTRKIQAGVRQDASDTRGSSAFVDGARFVANLGMRTSGLLELRVTKANYTLPGPPLVLARRKGGGLRPATVDELAEELAGVEAKAVARSSTARLAKQAPKEAWRKDENTL